MIHNSLFSTRFLPTATLLSVAWCPRNLLPSTSFAICFCTWSMRMRHRYNTTTLWKWHQQSPIIFLFWIRIKCLHKSKGHVGQMRAEGEYCIRSPWDWKQFHANSTFDKQTDSTPANFFRHEVPESTAVTCNQLFLRVRVVGYSKSCVPLPYRISSSAFSGFDGVVVHPIIDLPARLNYGGYPTSSFPVVKKIVHRITVNRPCPA